METDVVLSKKVSVRERVPIISAKHGVAGYMDDSGRCVAMRVPGGAIVIVGSKLTVESVESLERSAVWQFVPNSEIRVNVVVECPTPHDMSVPCGVSQGAPDGVRGYVSDALANEEVSDGTQG